MPQGVETLALRGKAHSENANALAQWLSEQPAVKKVSHPSLSSHPSHARAIKYFRSGHTYYGCTNYSCSRYGCTAPRGTRRAPFLPLQPYASELGFSPIYPGCHPMYFRPGCFGAVLTFEIKGTDAAQVSQ